MAAPTSCRPARFLARVRQALAPQLTRGAIVANLSARVGSITARAKVVAQTDRDMIVEADLIDADDVTVATATAELRILDKR